MLVQLASAQERVDLYVRQGDKLVEAPSEDLALARTYRGSKMKGRIYRGSRITIMTHKKKYKVGEKVRVLHAFETVEPGQSVPTMGPEEIYQEYVDGRLATPASRQSSYYGGIVVPSPALTFNYEITSYVFTEPGPHRIQWRMVPGELESNSLVIQVMK